MKKLFYAVVLALCLSFFGISSTAFASENVDSLNNEGFVEQNALLGEVGDEIQVYSTNPDKPFFGLTEYPTPYSQITTFPDGSVTGIDFSEATFFDEEGNVIESDLVTPFASGSATGGSWSSGTGYSCVKGIKVHGGSIFSNISMNFKADFCNNQGVDDQISRIYSSDISTYEWEMISQGIFRAKETFEYSAYGGVKIKARLEKGGNQRTAYTYLRVAKDTYWVEASW